MAHPVSIPARYKAKERDVEEHQDIHERNLPPEARILLAQYRFRFMGGRPAYAGRLFQRNGFHNITGIPCRTEQMVQQCVAKSRRLARDFPTLSCRESSSRRTHDGPGYGLDAIERSQTVRVRKI